MRQAIAHDRYHHGNYLRHRRLALVFPYTDDLPSGSPQEPGLATVPVPIRGQLGQPVRPVGLGLAAVPRAPVPEAAIDEYRHAAGAMDDVCVDPFDPAIDAESQTSRMQGGAERPFRAGIPAMDPSHDLGTSERTRHQRSREVRPRQPDADRVRSGDIRVRLHAGAAARPGRAPGAAGRRCRSSG